MHLTASDYQALEASALFRGMSIESLGVRLASCAIRQAGVGDVLLQPGRTNDVIYIVLNGELDVHLHSIDGEPQARLGTGDCVGEMSLVDGQPVSAWVIATGDARLLTVPHEMVWSLVESSEVVARNLLGVLSGRVRRNNLTLIAAESRSLAFEETASVDLLTGLHNRRWLTQIMPRVLQRCERDGQPVVLVLADADHFVQFCGAVTPLVRDDALRRIATALADAMRAQDMIARLQNDIFAIVLTRTEIDESMIIAERLREKVAALGIGPDHDSPLMTLSCGLTVSHVSDTLDSLLARAGDALAQAKQNGRDCVEAVS